MLTIQQIKLTPPDTAQLSPTTKAMVLDISPIEPATAKCKAKFFVILADITSSISCTVYDVSQYSKFKKDHGVILVNILIKQSYIAVTERSEVGMLKAFDIPEEIKCNAPKLPGDQEMTIEMAKGSPVKTMTNIKGKVVNVLPAITKEFNDNTLPFQDIVIKDKSGSITLALWDENANKFEKGQVIKVTKCRVKLINGEKKLSTTRTSNGELYNDEEEFKDISDEEEMPVPDIDKNSEVGTISSVFDIDPYLSCVNKGCNNSKLITVLHDDKYVMQCKTCKLQMRASNANNYMRATVFFESSNITKKVAIFQPQILELFKSRGIHFTMSYDKEELLAQMYELLPVNVRCKIVNNTIRSMSVKRDAEALN